MIATCPLTLSIANNSDMKKEKHLRYYKMNIIVWRDSTNNMYNITGFLDWVLYDYYQNLKHKSGDNISPGRNWTSNRLLPPENDFC